MGTANRKPRRVHYVGDGGSNRRAVFVDGVQVSRVVLADIKRGRVECHHNPLLIVKGRIVRKVLRGVIEVREMQSP